MGNLTAHALTGGVGSALGGGKFASGAATAAFGYMFNQALHQQRTAEPVMTSSSGYASADSAAQAAVDAAFGFPDFDRLEYGGFIYKDNNGWEFSMFRGTEGNISISVTSDVDVQDWWHTHPNIGGGEQFVFSYAEDHNEDLSSFKGGDVDITAKLDKIFGRILGAYLFTPSHELKFYSDPTKNLQSRTIPFEIPK